jgi:hypothetical protein
VARRPSTQIPAALAACALATAVATGCPPRELRVVIEDLEGAVEECVSPAGTLESCGPPVDVNSFVGMVNGEYRVAEGACVAVQLALVARPSEPDGPWPKKRRSKSACVELAKGTGLEGAIADAVDRSLEGGLFVEDVESAEDAVFVLGLFGSASDSCDCQGASKLFACSALGADSEDTTKFGIACTQCSGRRATNSTFATCSAFADERCFFEGCEEVFVDP